MTYAEIEKERDDLKTENGTLRSIMYKMLEKCKSLEDENRRLKNLLEKEVSHLQNVCRILERALNNAIGMDHMYPDAYEKAKEELIQEGKK